MRGDVSSAPRIPIRRHDRMFCNAASLVDNCLSIQAVLTLTIHFLHPNNSTQQQFIKIVSHTSMSTRDRFTDPHLQSEAGFEEFLLIPWIIPKKVNCFCAPFPEVLGFLCSCQTVLCAGLLESCVIIQGRKMDSSDHWLLHSKLGGVLNLLFYLVLLTNYTLCRCYTRSILYLCHLELSNYIHLNFRLTLLDNCSHHSFTSANMWFLMCLTNLHEVLV